jgi:hypothetical protein
VSALFVYGGKTARTGVMSVSVSGYQGRWLYPLDTVETIRVAGPVGDTVARIEGGTAWIVSSECRNQLCVAAPPVRKHGQWIACLPNQVLVSIDYAETADSGNIDMITW